MAKRANLACLIPRVTGIAAFWMGGCEAKKVWTADYAD